MNRLANIVIMNQKRLLQTYGAQQPIYFATAFNDIVTVTIIDFSALFKCSIVILRIRYNISSLMGMWHHRLRQYRVFLISVHHSY